MSLEASKIRQFLISVWRLWNFVIELVGKLWSNPTTAATATANSAVINAAIVDDFSYSVMFST